jgi:hypothetical protein
MVVPQLVLHGSLSRSESQFLFWFDHGLVSRICFSPGFLLHRSVVGLLFLLALRVFISPFRLFFARVQIFVLWFRGGKLPVFFSRFPLPLADLGTYSLLVDRDRTPGSCQGRARFPLSSQPGAHRRLGFLRCLLGSCCLSSILVEPAPGL